MIIVITPNLRTIVFLHYTDHYLHLRNTLCLWATNIDIMRSQEILLRRDFVCRLIIALDCKYRQRRETTAKENAGEGIAARI